MKQALLTARAARRSGPSDQSGEATRGARPTRGEQGRDNALIFKVFLLGVLIGKRR